MSENMRSQFQLQQIEKERLQSQLQQTQAELAAANATIAWMHTSKFWKLRSQALKLKTIVKKIANKDWQPFTPAPAITATSIDSTTSLQKDLPSISLPPSIPEIPTVLLIVESRLPQCLRYRVQQKIEQLQAINYEVRCIPWTEYNTALKQLHFCHVVIFYRVPAYPEVVRTIEYAKHLRKITLFDVDDLIFERDTLSEKVDSFRGQLSESERAELLKGTVLYREALSLCHYAIASTPALAKKMGEVVGSTNTFVHRNAIDAVINKYLEFPLPKLPRDYVSIFYGSGTRTHDGDFAIVAPALVQILEKYDRVRLTIIGYLTLPDSLTPYSDRIDRIQNLLSIESYLEFLSQADINIAPLEEGIFADCKSEIKWLEAAMLKIPSIVTATQTYLEVLEDGVDALIVRTQQDWFNKLDFLVSNPELRQAIAENAYTKAQSNSHPTVMADNLKNIFNSAIQQSAQQGLVTLAQNKKKLLFVNVLYPPQALGGATVMVKNIVDTLKAKRHDYEISVFTYDIENPAPYEISEYTQDGINVTSLSVAHGDDIDWRYQDIQVQNIFRQYLAFHQPDLIHFHCIQRLTASVMEAAKELDIPYIVTVHDAWWLGDRQFLIDKDGLECDPRQNDPIIAARYSDDINNAILRRRYLAQRLNSAKTILAVSEFQADLYRKNGFTQIQVNRNGIMPQKILPRSPANKIRLGYAGGICVHKGYYFLKDAILAADLQNTELTVIDLFVSGAARRETWGNTLVTFIPKLPADKMPQFYSNIDVLVAPSVWAESFGLITREAVLAGVWVVASNKGGLAEDITPGINGDVFSTDSLDELVSILKKLDKEPCHYQQQRDTDAIQIRSINEQVSELESIYESIIDRQNVF
jgi:glycosyltransferase involved in cell wall biosynthesis